MPNIQIIIPKFVLQNDDKKNLRRVLNQSGREMVKAATALVRRAGGSGRYYPIGHTGHYASAPGQPPASLTGLLSSSIKSKVFVRKSESGVRISDTALTADGKPYAKFLQVGAAGGGPGLKNIRANKKKGIARKVMGKRILEPRPFISTVVEQMAPAVGQKIVDAFVADIEFVQN